MTHFTANLSGQAPGSAPAKDKDRVQVSTPVIPSTGRPPVQHQTRQFGQLVKVAQQS